VRKNISVCVCACVWNVIKTFGKYIGERAFFGA